MTSERDLTAVLEKEHTVAVFSRVLPLLGLSSCLLSSSCLFKLTHKSCFPAA